MHPVRPGHLLESGMDVLMALLYAPGASGKVGEEIRGITRLEKLLFLLEKETAFGEYLRKDYKFEPYHYGPYSVEVFDQIEALEDAGLVETTTVEAKHSVETYDALQIELDVIVDDTSLDTARQETKKLSIYKLTEKGMKVGKALFDSLSEDEKRKLNEVKTKFNSISLQRLLRYIYTKYPEAAKESVIKGEILEG